AYCPKVEWSEEFIEETKLIQRSRRAYCIQKRNGLKNFIETRQNLSSDPEEVKLSFLYLRAYYPREEWSEEFIEKETKLNQRSRRVSISSKRGNGLKNLSKRDKLNQRSRRVSMK
ncbi:hypothetical protein CEXT_606851, partial [Caerostris extrusa]